MSRKPASGGRRRRLSLRRLIGLDANPLRRRVDRAEAWIVVGLLVLFLVGAPLASIAVGRWADTATRSAADAHAAAVHQVSATVLREVPNSASDSAHGAVGWVAARWRAPDGKTRVGEVQAPLGTRANTQVKIWVDRSGQVADPPLTQGQVTSRVITAIALAPLVLGLALAFVFGLTHRLLERRRMLAWEAAWTAVEPQWTRRAH